MTQKRRVFALTWTIPDDFGGLTNVLLHRSAALARAGAQVEILTLAPDLDLTAKTEALRESGQLPPEVPLRNLFHELREMRGRELRRFAGRGKDPRAPRPARLPFDGGTEAVRRNADGRETQKDQFRPGGGTLLTDEREPGSARRLTLWSRWRRPLAEWSSARSLYFAWLDHVIGQDDADLINDSQFIGGFLADYRRAHVTVAQVIHNTHLDARAADAFGRLSGRKAEILKNLDRFDLVAALTRRQAGDIRVAGFADDNLVAIPNSRNVDVPDATRERDPRRGAVVARLSGQKRLDHAIRAMSLASEVVPGISLDVYGDGPERERLAGRIEAEGVADVVRLRGYQSGAAARFAEASFSVLSSRYEGMGLVLVESMAAGCIPVAYDIRYGPSDIITDGVDGFLVPDGDTAALGKAIAKVATLDEGTLAAMRRAAVRRAADFDDDTVGRQWVAELDAARERTRVRTPHPAPTAELTNAEANDSGVSFVATVATPDAASARGAFLTWIGRKAPVYGRVPAVVSHGPGDAFTVEATLGWARLGAADHATLDLFVDVVWDDDRTRTRLRHGASPHVAGEGWESYATVHGNTSLRRVE